MKAGYVKCPQCAGHGYYAEGLSTEECTGCHGARWVTKARRDRITKRIARELEGCVVHVGIANPPIKRRALKYRRAG